MIASFGLSRRSGNFSNELTEVQRDRLLDPFSSRTLALHQRQAIELTESFADGREYAREYESTDFQSRNPCPRGRHAYRVGFAEGILAVPPFPMVLGDRGLSKVPIYGMALTGWSWKWRLVIFRDDWLGRYHCGGQRQPAEDGRHQSQQAACSNRGTPLIGHTLRQFAEMRVKGWLSVSMKRNAIVSTGYGGIFRASSLKFWSSRRGPRSRAFGESDALWVREST